MKRTALLAALVAATPVLGLVSHAETPAYTVKALTLTTTVAAEGALGVTRCVVDADLYTPAGVDAKHPAPAILTTNGFGGSKTDQAGAATWAASHGYVVLSYSGLGFGADPQSGRRGSDCKISLDDRQHDGAAERRAASRADGRLVQSLGATLPDRGVCRLPLPVAGRPDRLRGRATQRRGAG